MIIVDVEQGSELWRELRRGIPTASNFSRILTAKTRKPAAGAQTYLCELLSAEIFGSDDDEQVSQFMARGNALEQQAIAWYALRYDCDPKRVGLVLNDARTVGCSPDALIGDDGGLEIKCLSAPKHIAAMLHNDDEHMPQIMGALWLTGRKWWSRCYYSPVLPPVVVRVERDEEYIGQLAEAVNSFVWRLNEARETLRSKGVRFAADFVATPEDVPVELSEMQAAKQVEELFR